MKIYIATDHRGVDIEDEVANYLTSSGMEVIKSKLEHHPTDDYTDFAFELGENVLNDKGSLGVLICGTGIGMSIAANKVKGIRAARCVDVDDAFYAKSHNACNVICIGTDVPVEKMYEIIDTFIHTKNADEERHIKRIEKIIKYEEEA